MNIRILTLCLITLQGFAQSTRIDQAKKLYESKKYAEAITALEGVKKGEKDYAAGRYYLGRVAFDKKEYDDAQDFFEEAVEADGTSAEYYNWLGNTYGQIAQDANVLKQGMLAPKMKAAWEKAVALDPSFIDLILREDPTGHCKLLWQIT